MPKKTNRFLFWTPRILACFFIVFLSLFSLDIFDMGLNFWQTIIGLFMHNIPSIILLIVLLISWKHELFGGIVFILAGVFYMIMTSLNIHDWWIVVSWSIAIAGPSILVGILFFINWFKKK